jgi:hypothetical protein
VRVWPLAWHRPLSYGDRYVYKYLGISQTICHVRAIGYSLPTLPCDRCGQPAPRFSAVARTAIDLDLEQPTLLHVTVSIHHCRACHHYFRAQPPFLRADAVYTNRVVTKAIQSVHHDGMAFRRTAARLARDFWVRPSEGSIRRWCRAYATAVDLDADYQPWVVQSFSGVLCIDEVYQGQLALLLAVDPAAPDGDRLIGYQLVTGSVQQTDVEPFLTRLRAAVLAPDQIVTDGSQLYPTVLKQIWPTAVHQLCLKTRPGASRRRSRRSTATSGRRSLSHHARQHGRRPHRPRPDRAQPISVVARAAPRQRPTPPILKRHTGGLNRRHVRPRSRRCIASTSTGAAFVALPARPDSPAKPSRPGCPYPIRR